MASGEQASDSAAVDVLDHRIADDLEACDFLLGAVVCVLEFLCSRARQVMNLLVKRAMVVSHDARSAVVSLLSSFVFSACSNVSCPNSAISSRW